MIGLISGAFAVEIAKAWKADDIEKQSLAKNSKAFGKQAEAKGKVEIHKEKLFDQMKINAIRKNAILQCHIKKFIDVYAIIDEYKLNRGLGIEEMEKIEAVKTQMIQSVNFPTIASGLAKSDTQLIVEYAVLGVGGLIMKEAKENSKLASRNMANANAVAAQADSICIFYDGLAERIQACTDILQKLAAKDIVAINHIESMLKSKGQNESLYTKEDVDAINLCSELNILIYEIINTPLIDENNEITQASKAIISKGQEYIKQLG
jgi:hypothetical protein